VEKSNREQISDILAYANKRGIVIPADLLLDISQADTVDIINAIKFKMALKPEDLPVYTMREPGAVPPPILDGMVLASKGWVPFPQSGLYVGGSGTNNHSLLTNLAFAVAGHTGFQGQFTILDTLGALANGAGVLTNNGVGVLSWAAAGITDHSALSNLTYAAAGHTGFEPADATIVKTGNANWIDLTDGGATTLHSHAAPAGMGDVIDSGIVVGQLTKGVTDSKHIIAAAIIPPVTNILTLTNAAASTLALAITGTKTLTLTSTGDFNLTVPATGTAALLGTANVFTVQQMVDGTADDHQLIVQAHSTQTSNIMEIQKSDATIWGGFDQLGRVFSYAGTSTTNFFAAAGGNATTAGLYNIGIGNLALAALTTSAAIDNVCTGYLSGRYITVGYGNCAIGSFTLNGATGTGITHNMAIGAYSLYSNTGHGNVGVGRYSLFSQTSGDYNIGIGYNSSQSQTTGDYNTTIGAYAGSGAGARNNNVVIGAFTGQGLTTGSSNVLLGYYAGRYTAALSNLLIIDNQDRTNAATEVTNAIIYGVMAATPAAQTLALNAVVSISDGLIVNEGGLATCDFRVESDTYDALFVDASANSIEIMHNTAGLIGHYGVAPVAQHAHIADATGAADVITTCNHILSVLEEYGLLAAA
jgi:hypothetical protein